MKSCATSLQIPAVSPSLFPLDPGTVFLNHGSFGSCPRAVLDHQQDLRMRLERQPVHFMTRDLEPMLDESRAALADFIGVEPDDLVLVPNATSGVNSVLRSLEFSPGDELLVTDHEYNASRNALNFVANRNGVKVVVVQLPFPLTDPEEVVNAVFEKVTERTRLLLIDHITSATALILPIRRIIKNLAARGIDTLVDGAHAPGMIPLNISEIGAAYYTGNCHKWICAPKGAAFLWVREDKQEAVRPLSISHGANSLRTDRSRFQLEFGWTGTSDPTAVLSLPRTIDYMSSLLAGGWSELMRRNHELALAAREHICSALEITAPAPAEMIGSIASIPIHDAENLRNGKMPPQIDGLQDELLRQHSIEIPIHYWPRPPKRLIRLSAQVYNWLPQYRRLAKAITESLA